MEANGQWWTDKLKLLEANYEKSKLKILQNTLRCKLSIVQIQNAVEQEKGITQKYQKKAVTGQLAAVKGELAKQIKEKEDISREAKKIKEEQKELLKTIESLEKQKDEIKLHNETVQKMSEELDVLRRKENEWKCINLKLDVSKLDKIEEELAKQIKQKECISREAEKIKEEQKDLVKRIESLEKQKEDESKLHNVTVQKMSEELDILRRKENEWKCKNLKPNVSKLDKIEEVQTRAATAAVTQTTENNIATEFTKASNIASKHNCASPELSENDDKVLQSPNVENSWQNTTQKPNEVFDNRKDTKDNTLIDGGDWLDIETSYLKKTDRILRNCRKQSVSKRRALSDVGDFSENSAAGKGRGKRNRSQTKLKKYDFRSNVLKQKQRRVSFSNDLKIRLFEKGELLKEKGNEKLVERNELPTPDDNVMNESVVTAATDNDFSVITRSEGDLESDVVPENGQDNAQESSNEKRNRKTLRSRHGQSGDSGIANERQTSQTTKPEQETVARESYQERDLSISVEKCQNDVHPQTNGANLHQENQLNDKDAKKENNQNGRRRSLRRKYWKDKHPEINDVVCKDCGYKESQSKVHTNKICEVTETNNDLRSNKEKIVTQSPTHVPFAELGRESEKTRFAVEKRPIRELRKYVTGIQPGKRLVETFGVETCRDKRVSKQSCEKTEGNADVPERNEIEEEMKKKNGKFAKGRKKEETPEQAINTDVEDTEKYKEENVRKDEDESGTMQSFKRRLRPQRNKTAGLSSKGNRERNVASQRRIKDEVSKDEDEDSMVEDGIAKEKKESEVVSQRRKKKDVPKEEDKENIIELGIVKEKKESKIALQRRRKNEDEDNIVEERIVNERKENEVQALQFRKKEVSNKEDEDNVVQDGKIKRANEHVVMQNVNLGNEKGDSSLEKRPTKYEEDRDVNMKTKNKTGNQVRKEKIKDGNSVNLVEEFEEHKQTPGRVRKRVVSKDQSKCEVNETVIKEKRKKYEKKGRKVVDEVNEKESKDVMEVGTANLEDVMEVGTANLEDVMEVGTANLEAAVNHSGGNNLTSDGNATRAELEGGGTRIENITQTIEGNDVAGETLSEDKTEKSLKESGEKFLTSLKEEDDHYQQQNAAKVTIDEEEKITGERAGKENRKRTRGKGKSKATENNVNLGKNAEENISNEIGNDSGEILAKPGLPRKLRGKERRNKQTGRGKTTVVEKKSTDVREEVKESVTEREESSTNNVSVVLKVTNSVRGTSPNNKKSGVLSKPVIDPEDITMQPLTKKRKKLYNNRENSIMMNKTSALFQETLPLNSTRSGGGMSNSLSTFMKAFIVPKLKKQTASKKNTNLTRKVNIAKCFSPTPPLYA